MAKTNDNEVGYEVEYNTLRAEILQNHKNCLQIIGFAITGTVVILGYAFQSEETNANWLFMLPLIVLIPCLFLYIGQVAATFRMGAYIRVFLESKTECKRLNFESRWFHYRGSKPEDWTTYKGIGKKQFLFINDHAGLLVLWSLIFICMLLGFSLLSYGSLSGFLVNLFILGLDAFICFLLFSSWKFNQQVVYNKEDYEVKWIKANTEMNSE
jgi:hypothetical protein